ncbi:hypothetical protein TspCOW1_05250 [Thiohalobacter sp. COW1]|nr:hypothetical protein TspCOW1_05250 [Thiohalobacter sp. COW1]
MSSEEGYWPKQEGRVLDATTGKPIVDALVVARWKGVSGYTNTVCYHVESTMTDKQGRYEVPAWRNDTRFQNLQKEHVEITPFKAGYEESDRTYKEHSYKQGIYYLMNFEGTKAERLDYLLRIPVACSSAGYSERNMFDFYLARYKEARNIAVTDKEKEIVTRFKESAASSAISTDDLNLSAREEEKRIQEFLRANPLLVD